MRQFFAVMRDSYREARDGWVIYVMLGFSALLILLTLSISFRPDSMESRLTKHLEPLNFVLKFARQPGAPAPPSFGIENYRQTNGAAEPWRGDYAWDLVLTYASEKDKEAAKSNPSLPFSEDFVREMYSHDQFFFLKKVRVKESNPSPTETRYSVTTEGTRIDDVRAWPHEIKIFFGLLSFGIVGGTGDTVNEAVYNIEKWGIQQVGAWITLLVGVVITSYFIPNMLRKGTIDLFISKPIHRVTLLVYKYLGGLIFMFLLVSVTVLGVWLALGVRSGIWGTGFLWVIPGMMFYFAILYAVSTLAGVLTRSPIVCILATCAAWGIFFANGWVHGRLETARKQLTQFNPGLKDDPAIFREVPGVPRWAVITSDVVNAVLPRTYEVDNLNAYLIARSVLSKAEMERKGFDEAVTPSWAGIVGVSSAFIAVALALACWRFVRMEP